MSNEIQKPFTFEEKLKARIREEIGNMITDAELAEIVKRSMNELFFQEKLNPKWVNANQWDQVNIPKTIPCLAHAWAMELTKPIIEQAVREWIAANHQTVETIIRECLRTRLAESIVQGFVQAATKIVEPSLDMLRGEVLKLSTRR